MSERYSIERYLGGTGMRNFPILRLTSLFICAVSLGACRKATSNATFAGVTADCVTVPEKLVSRRAPPPPAQTTEPVCEAGSAVCSTWREFRLDHPYPYQAFAGKALGTGRAVLIISEPPPGISHADATAMIQTVFADRNPAIETRRWKILSDGFVEDIVVALDADDIKGDDLLSSPDFRDRIAALQQAWFGTTCGGDVEQIGGGAARESGIAPNLEINVAEVKSWLADPKTTWTPIEDFAEAPMAWPALSEAQSNDAYLSQDGQLVLLTFPKPVVDDPEQMQALRLPFRRFAASSDALLSVVWTENGQVGLVGRRRTRPLSQIPALRFETFAQLVTQHGDHLSQSYERGSALAGPTQEGNRDWAPVYLSTSLIDTEFGNLLNVTDQMLKGWSEAGTVTYLNFNYPLTPGRYPFGSKPLSQLVHDKTGSDETLFNWNTSGSAVALKDGPTTFFVARQLGSLPITYGSDLGGTGAIQTGHLMEFEDQAYSWFSGLGDPNLARVVQYTVLYQAFRNLREDGGETSEAAEIGRLRAGTLALADDLAKYLTDLRGTFGNDGDRLQADVDRFKKSYPSVDNAALAILLADRLEGPEYLSSQDSANAGTYASQEFNDNLAILASNFQHTVWVASSIKLEPVRQKFEAANDRKVTGWQRTPSNVVSWARAVTRTENGWTYTTQSIGGHNLDAAAQRFEAVEGAQGVELGADNSLIYSPERQADVEAHATQLARAVEHKRASAEEINAILDTPVESHARWQALGFDSPEIAQTSNARLGGRAFALKGEF